MREGARQAPGVAGFAHGVGGTLLAQQTADEWRAEAAKRSRHKARENFQAHKPARIGEGRVAGEKFVAAEARERDLQADLARGPGNEVSVEAVHRGLIEGADGIGDAASERCFVIRRIRKREREALDTFLRASCECGDGAGVEAARKK